MRLYLFNNHYISAIQHGIQGLHSFAELFVRHGLDSPQARVVMDWNREHKTVIVLNGGYADTLQTVFDRLEAVARDWTAGMAGIEVLPVAKFHEEQAALAGALTSVAVVVPAGAYFEGPSGRAARKALMDKAAALGFEDLLEASGDRGHFTPVERLALLCMNFPLA